MVCAGHQHPLATLHQLPHHPGKHTRFSCPRRPVDKPAKIASQRRGDGGGLLIIKPVRLCLPVPLLEAFYIQRRPCFSLKQRENSFAPRRRFAEIVDRLEEKPLEIERRLVELQISATRRKPQTPRRLAPKFQLYMLVLRRHHHSLANRRLGITPTQAHKIPVTKSRVIRRERNRKTVRRMDGTNPAPRNAPSLLDALLQRHRPSPGKMRPLRLVLPTDESPQIILQFRQSSVDRHDS